MSCMGIAQELIGNGDVFSVILFFCMDSFSSKDIVPTLTRSVKQTNKLPLWLQDLMRLVQWLHNLNILAALPSTDRLRHFGTSKCQNLLPMDLAELNGQHLNCQEVPEVTCLPTKQCGHSLLLENTLDNQVKEYVTALRATAGVVNTVIVLAAAEGIVAATDRSDLRRHGGTLVLTKSWNGIC